MAKKIRLELTEAQFEAIVSITDEISAMVGVGEPEDALRARWVKLIDRMLNNNGYKRNFN